MNVHVFLVLFFSSVPVFLSMLLVNTEKPLKSVLFLNVLSSNFMAIYLLFQYDTLVARLLLGYIFSLILLFMFFLVMFNIKILELNEIILKYVSVSFICILLLTCELIAVELLVALIIESKRPLVISVEASTLVSK